MLNLEASAIDFSAVNFHAIRAIEKELGVRAIEINLLVSSLPAVPLAVSELTEAFGSVFPFVDA